MDNLFPRMPRVVMGIPVYGQAEQLRIALGSLLAQTCGDFALVLVDDRSPDDSVAVARELAAGDPRVTIEVNERRLGMLANTNRAWQRSRTLYPGAEYWALGSDHDVWDPRWMERLVAALDAAPRAVLAYPLTERVDADGHVVRGSFTFDTAGMSDPHARLHKALRAMVSGDMIYGLFRAAALDRLGFYRSVLAPDRLLLSELALAGEFVQVPERLWRRRYVGIATLRRQRRAFWPDGGTPPRAYLPWWIVHTGSFARRHGVRSAAVHYAPASALFQLRSRALRASSALVAPAVRRTLREERVRHAVREIGLPALQETREVLARLVQEAEA